MGGSSKDRTRRQQKKAQKNKAKRVAEKKNLALSLPQTSMLERPKSFADFAELAQYAEGNVYIVARLRKKGEQVIATTLGTGFLAGRNRMITCAHVIDNKDDPHMDGDAYVFVMRTASLNGATVRFHKSFQGSIIRDKTLFVDHHSDAAIIYLDDSFYVDQNGTLVKDPNQYLELTKTEKRIGTAVGILGYPMQEIGFTEQGDDIEIGGVLLRADTGIVNLNYYVDGVARYDFTMAFNPGNSGGPILDIKTGEVIAYVHGYQSVPINMAKDNIPDHLQEEGSPTVAYTTIRALYSKGLSSLNLLAAENQHNIVFRQG